MNRMRARALEAVVVAKVSRVSIRKWGIVESRTACSRLSGDGVDGGLRLFEDTPQPLLNAKAL
jgi:hypothetical protein